MTTPYILRADPRWEIYILVDSEQEKEAYESLSPGLNIYVGEGGFPLIKDWARREFCSPGEWVCFFEDNLKEFWAVAEDHYYHSPFPYDEIRADMKQKGVQWREGIEHVFNKICSASRLYDIVQEDISIAEEFGVHMTGFASNDNPFFRLKKYRWVGHINGKTVMQKNDEKVFRDPKFRMMDDFNFSAAQLFTYGRVLINNYVFWKYKPFEAGGLGSAQDREAKCEQEQRDLLEKYPGMFHPVVRKQRGIPEVKMRFTQPEQVVKWKQSL